VKIVFQNSHQFQIPKFRNLKIIFVTGYSFSWHHLLLRSVQSSSFMGTERSRPYELVKDHSLTVGTFINFK